MTTETKDPRDIIAQLIRVEAGKTGAGALSEKMVSALDAAGYAIVPKEPTPEMVNACGPIDHRTGIYRAMVAAGSIKP